MFAFISLFLIALSRISLNPLPYFFVTEGLMILLVITRKRFEYWVLILITVFPLSFEAVALFMNAGKLGHIFGTITSTITAFLGLMDEMPREKLIRKIKLKGRKNRQKVKTLMFTYGRIAKLEKIQMSTTHALVSGDKLYFSLRMPFEGETLMSIPLKELKEVAVQQVISEVTPYLPRTRDLFIPIKNIRSIGKPKHMDYFLVLRTADNIWTFYEEPETLLNFQKEIETAMEK
ncbi:hypothetical protein AT15_03385 [Kosmotoga arenicorallina S304]|uniref:Uncharacterized protein n=1 Tax=Kosmotoga arenicorallina S304 TaxID=1453497 RepID=A0A182C7Z6_9BACT|nr:hypothetical protein [Kosmotoga arenicorallina]OAA31880.1 hypothetical protein AT15_03385 [Kosmotoga arenicorallina S304]